MRYARMVRKPPARDECARPRFSPDALSKRANTVALDLRQALLSLRGPNLVLAIITAPFILAVLLFAVHPPALRDADELARVPYAFRKYGYDSIREGLADAAPHQPGRRVPVQVPQFLAAAAARRKHKIDPERSVSLIAACRDRKESLGLSLPSWEAIQGIDDIVLVDWSSDVPEHDLPRLPAMVRAARVAYIRVENAPHWVLSRAYNLAARFATGKYILKVDCDTHLDPAFLNAHPFPQQGQYYSVTWGSERNTNEQKLRGVWFGLAADFRNVGGYDERIATYGYEDIDFYRRLNGMPGAAAKPLNLDTVRHNVAGHVVWQKNESVKTSHRISTRMNQAILQRAIPWGKALASGNVTKYDFSHDEKTGFLYARVVSQPSDPLSGEAAEDLSKMRMDVLQKALHDDFNIPWDILPSLPLEDLEYLAGYLDNETGSHVIVVSLEGTDTLSNLFNLVSALQLGITHARPVIVIWGPPHGAHVDQSDGATVRQLFDLEATNELLRQAPQSDIARKHAFSGATRLIAAKQWPCVESLSACSEKYDAAYGAFSEIVMQTPRVYDEKEPLPLSIKLHGFVRLGNLTKIGNEETRRLAYNSLVQSHVVREAQQTFPLEGGVGVLAASAVNVSRFVTRVREGLGSALGSDKRMVPIVGRGQYRIRRELYGKERQFGFCEGQTCTIRELARELANVLSMCGTEDVLPTTEQADREAWMQRHDVTGLMVADLRALRRGK